MGDLSGNISADKITKVSRTLPQNRLQRVKNEHDKQIPKETYISPKEGQKTIDDLTLI